MLGEIQDSLAQASASIKGLADVTLELDQAATEATFTVQPGGSFRVSLAMAQLFGLVDRNHALASAFKEGRFHLVHGLERSTVQWVLSAQAASVTLTLPVSDYRVECPKNPPRFSLGPTCTRDPVLTVTK